MPIPPELPDAAGQIIEAAAQRGCTLRLLGGLAVRLHSPSATHRLLARSYPDLDFALAEKRADQAEAILADLGYTPNKGFNLLNGDRRLLFFDEGNGRQVDVFVGGFQMCHRIPITLERIQLEPVTLPLAELLLTKMQIIQLNEKDVRDLCALLLDHPFGEGDTETINLPYLARLCAQDWGLWKTVNVTTRKVHSFCDAYELEAGQKLTITGRLAVLARGLDAAPKSLKWKARDKIGERLQWYELPEEVQRG
ncbi:MAG: hypothetical protein AB1791_08460 [Chloroflexota bacterium]